MVRATLLILAIWSAASSATAMPVLSRLHSIPAAPTIEAKIICGEDGKCYRPPTRHPVARWVYGDGAFFGPGPYTGPGYYGSPGSHWRWFPFFGF
jgi:hypothetical protein